MGDLSDLRMPFGTHEGERVGDLPNDYIGWLLREVTFKSERLREAVEAEAEDRISNGLMSEDEL